MLRTFGRLLSQKRNEAHLSITELALMSGVTETRLEAWEQGNGESPDFDMCYKIGQAITAKSGQGFVVQDLWQALRSDKILADPRNEFYFVS
jgi:transcriptional regulator with XRE-family HTH domain